MDWDIIVCTIVANAGESRSASLAAIEAAGMMILKQRSG